MEKSWTFLNVWEGRPRAHWGHRALVRTARCVLRRCKTNKHGMGYRLPDILWNWYCRRHAASPPERVVVECVFWCMLRFERPNKMQLKMPRRLVYPAAPSARAYPGHFWAGQLATGMPLWKVGNFDVSHGKYDTWIWLYTSNEACMRSLRHILRAWCRPAGYGSSRLTRFVGAKKNLARSIALHTRLILHIWIDKIEAILEDNMWSNYGHYRRSASISNTHNSSRAKWTSNSKLNNFRSKFKRFGQLIRSKR